MGPPLARAYNYVKFIETGEGRWRGEGRGTFWLKQDLSKMGNSNTTHSRIRNIIFIYLIYLTPILFVLPLEKVHLFRN